MKKIILRFFILILLSFSTLIFILSTIGIETERFNDLISKKINKTNNNLSLTLNTIKFKFDIKEISLFLDIFEPKIIYRNTFIPAENIKVYVDFVSLIKTKPNIKKMNINFQSLNIDQLKIIADTIKPSNLKSLINNRIKKGNLTLDLEVYLDENNLLENFIARGYVSNLEAEINDNLNLKNTNFNFFADQTDILIKNINGESKIFKISDGDLKLIISKEIFLQSNFHTSLQHKDKSSINFLNLSDKLTFMKDLTNLEAELDHSFTISFDKTYKIKNYNYKNNGEILIANFDFKKPLMNYISTKKIDRLSLTNVKINTNYNSTNNKIDLLGKYSLNKENFLSFNLDHNLDDKLFKLNINAEYDEEINLPLINYKKTNNSIANFSINLEKYKDKIKIKKINFTEKNNLIFIENLKFDKNKFLSFKKILVKTYKKNEKNNDFSILYGKKIIVKGSKFDASNLPKILKKKTSEYKFSSLNKEIEIDFKNIKAPLAENLKNFKLIGEIKKGKFIKISSKGDFGDNNFLDISIKSDDKNKKKILEIYSDLTRPLLTEYSFFKGLSGGKLLYSSIIEGNDSISKLKIENFKVINAPGMVKLLSLADLGGLADLAEGEGLSFDFLEIRIKKTEDFLELNEIIAIGPSISVLMEGYQEKNGLTSLRGSLIPAKTFNKIISKIPVLGDIIIPKEVGEGLFGISFKMKGFPGKIKTTINPIRTITPRFIQKIIDRNKNTK